ncbi:MAG: hypothetical protein HC851_16255 [Acaryochloris sp. RU_4_1]|nr:hypothetical protein [Acaryochloris sp. RU_4_1]NJR56083.1 hypothetical protein [Acaryochloris sp. CRU_2_0]
MTYTDRSIERSSVDEVIEYHDRVRWGPIFAGLVVALSVQLVLSGLAAAIGLTNIADTGVPNSASNSTVAAIGIGSIISLFIALFVGGWITARASGPMS